MSDTVGGKTIAERLGPVQAGLRSDLEVTRHVFRGQPQYVVRDPLTFQTHQFSQYDYQILVALHDGASLEEIFQQLVAEGCLRDEQQEEFYQFILTLHRLNFLILPISDSRLLYERFASRQRLARWRQMGSFLFLRVPLINPDAFLDRTADLVRPVFSRVALLLWVVMMCAGLGILVRRWDAFMDPMHSILASETLLFLWLALIGLKVVHEFGHAYACKIFGGKVPEMGAFFIAFTPCAYVDASSAWGFSRLGHRVVVSLAGMYFESVIALLALIVWCTTESPLISSCAHHVVVLSSAVTIGFNINPLMRYDGYYVLSDLTGIPNLRQRSIEQVQAVLKRLLLGISTPASGFSKRERALLVIYGIASSVYKVMLIMAICTMIALKFYVVGIALATFFLLGILVGVLRRLVDYLWRSRETHAVRGRAVALSIVLLAVVPVAVATVPVPGRVVVPGVVQTRENKVVYAKVDGILDSPLLQTGQYVARGHQLGTLQNVAIQTALEQSRAEAEVARLRYARGLQATPQMAVAARSHWIHAQARLQELERDRQQLVLQAPLAGVITRAADGQETGRFVRRGEPVGTIAAGPWTVRCLASAEQIAAARPAPGQRVDVRLQLDGIAEVTGVIDKVAVKGTHEVFSPVLTQLGGGSIAVDPQTRQTDKPMFEMVVRLPPTLPAHPRHDGRAMVLFHGESRTCGAHAYRRFQQFLNRLRVK